MHRVLPLSLILGTLAGIVDAQDPPFHAREVARVTHENHNFADVWADGVHVFIAHANEGEIDVLDLTDPANPVPVASWVIPVPPFLSTHALDVKAGDDLMFAALDGGLTDGVEIVDVRDPSNPAHLTFVNVEPGAYESIHNMFYADGWLYLANSLDATVPIIDLRGFDPNMPPATITAWTWRLTGVGSIVHDITVVGDRLYVAAWKSLHVYDVSDLDSGPPVLLASAPGYNVHAIWPTDDENWLVTAEEREGGGVRLYEVIDRGASLDLVPRGSFALPTSRAYSSHNVLVMGDRVFVSYYQAGLIVLEIDRATGTLEEVASFDTSSATPSFFEGCWGVYPFLGEDRVLLTDQEEGLFVIDTAALQVSWPGGHPELLVPGEPARVSVRVDGLGPIGWNPASVTLHARVDGGPTVVASMAQAGALHEADLPAVNSLSRVEYYVSASDSEGRLFGDPIDAPASWHVAHCAAGRSPVFVDDFELDRGWSVTSSAGLTTGDWDRGDPVGSGAQPERGAPGSLGDACFVTAQGTVGGFVTQADVDGGSTSLTSPSLDFSAGDGWIRFARWFLNDRQDGDSLRVELSGDDGVSWSLVEDVTEESGGWIDETVRVSDHVVPSGNVRIRFTASDDPDTSVTEAALDELAAEVFETDTGSLVLTIDPLVPGQLARSITSGSLPGELTIFGASLQGVGQGPCLFGGTVCLGLVGNLFVLGSAIADGRGLATLTLQVPTEISGATFHVQALVVRPPNGRSSLASEPVSVTAF